LFFSVITKCSLCEDENIGKCVKLKDSDTFFKVGILIRKRYGKAFQRNRAKRILKAQIRNYLPFIKKFVCFTVMIEDKFKFTDNEALRKEIESFLRKYEIIDKIDDRSY